MEARESSHEKSNQSPLDTGSGCLCGDRGQLCAVVESGDDVPAYHPAAPLKVSALPPILSGTQLKGENFRYPWQVHVYQQAAKIGNVLYQLPAIAAATARWAHQPTQLLRGTSRDRVLDLRQRGILRIPGVEAGQDAGRDSGVDRPPRVRVDCARGPIRQHAAGTELA